MDINAPPEGVAVLWFKPFDQIIRVTIGSRPGASGRRTSPVCRRLLKTAPSGAPAPILFATSILPKGVARLPGDLPARTLRSKPDNVQAVFLVIKLEALIRYTDQDSVITILGRARREKSARPEVKKATNDGSCS